MTTNYALYSRDLENSVWTQKDSITSGVVGPDGVTTDGYLITETGANQNFIAQAITVSGLDVGTSWTGSFYIKLTGSNEGDGTVSLRLSRIGGAFEVFANTLALSSVWQRVVVTAEWAQAGHTGVNFVLQKLASGPEEVHVARGMFQEGSHATNWVETFDVPVAGSGITPIIIRRRRSR